MVFSLVWFSTYNWLRTPLIIKINNPLADLSMHFYGGGLFIGKWMALAQYFEDSYHDIALEIHSVVSICTTTRIWTCKNKDGVMISKAYSSLGMVEEFKS